MFPSRIWAKECTLYLAKYGSFIPKIFNSSQCVSKAKQTDSEMPCRFLKQLTTTVPKAVCLWAELHPQNVL